MTDTKERILVAVYPNEADAQHAVEQLNEKGGAMDMVSVLGRAHPSGDDVLGIYYPSAGARMKAWARQGALCSTLGPGDRGRGADSSPGVGAVLAAGPIVEAMVTALGGGVLGAAVGGTLGGTAMTGAAAATHLGTVLHRMGIPPDHLDRLHASSRADTTWRSSRKPVPRSRLGKPCCSPAARRYSSSFLTRGSKT